ncbi:hypothetical protein BC834DRAFT_970441 [Gloeopeniophorella convolvens]|nr:hypothetical protein BC834DRAFT_970441 [Gloeopeniophorella convolvens]
MQNSDSLENVALDTSLSLSAAISSPFWNPLRETSRAAILEEINTTELRLRSLYPQLNSLAPVSLLPTELLTRIFHLLRDDQSYNQDTSWPPSWITSTRVCRRWREVSLSDPSLWSGIWTSSPMCTEKWLFEMLIRSKEAILDVDLRMPSAELLRSVALRHSHIRSLALGCLVDSPRDEHVQKLLASEAPGLEELYLGPKSFGSHVLLTNILPISLSEFGLFRGQAPKLRSIHLYQVHVPWAHFPRCTLTHLTITSSSGDEVEVFPPGNTGELIDILNNSPALEELTLNHCLTFTPPQPRARPRASANTIIDLPRLSQLTLLGPSSSVLRLLESVHTPALLDLRLLFVATNRAEVESWPAIAPSILARFYRTRSVVFNHLRLGVDHHSDWPTTQVNTEGPSSFAIPSPTCNTFVSLNFEDRSQAETDSLRRIISGVCTAIRLVELTSIYVTIPGYVDGPPFWTQFFQKCTGVTEFRASGAGTEPLLQLLKP